MFKDMAPQASGCDLYVRNLTENIDDNSLKEMFLPFGNVLSAKVKFDTDNNVSRGFGFVTFSTAEEATEAVLQMHQKLVDGKRLLVGITEKKQERLQRLLRAQGNGVTTGGPFRDGSGMDHGLGGRPMTLPYGAQVTPVAFPPPASFPAARSGLNIPPQVREPSFNFGAMARQRMAVPTPIMPVGSVKMNHRPQYYMGFHHEQAQPLTAAALAASPPAIQKQMLGNKLFPLVSRLTPEFAGKVTGMLLEMDNSELLIVLESQEQLRAKVKEAMAVLGNK